MYETELAAATRLARDAGKTILEHYALEIIAENKIGADNSSEPVTEADRAASEIIVTGLVSAFPKDGILSEEAADRTDERLSSERVWIIDPIDGTWGFVKKDGDFAVQIGLTIGGEPVLGVVYACAADILYYAARGGGAFAVVSGGEPKRLAVSKKTNAAEMIVATSRNHRNPRIKAVNEKLGFKTEIQRGSIGIKVGLIAEQVCDVYINLSPRSKFWDTCAPQAIIEEAGGVLTDLYGDKIRYDIRDVQNYNGIVAAGVSGHARIIANLRPILRDLGRLRMSAKGAD